MRAYRLLVACNTGSVMVWVNDPLKKSRSQCGAVACNRSQISPEWYRSGTYPDQPEQAAEYEVSVSSLVGLRPPPKIRKGYVFVIRTTSVAQLCNSHFWLYLTTIPPFNVKPQPFLVPEELLLRKLNRRDEVAFQWLYDQYAHVLYGVILTGLGQAALASRVLEEVFVSAWADFDQFNPRKTRLLTWLLTRARAEVAATLAKTTLLPVKSTIDYEVIDNPITPEQRTLLDAIYFRGQTVTQLAKTSQQSERTVQHRLRTALQELKFLFSQ